MSRLTKCDLCGEVTEERDFFSISQWTDTISLDGEVCPECLPDEIIESLNREESDV